MLIQISAGQGPVECQRVVWHVQRKLAKDFEEQSLSLALIGAEEGRNKNCFKSMTFHCRDEELLLSLRKEWEGTILWRGKSPFRPLHKRQNWFVKVSFCEEKDAFYFDSTQIKVEAYRRSSGPGGQHVNKASTAIRVTYLPTGDFATCSAERSQFQNKQMALRKLILQMEEKELQEQKDETADRRLQHYQLERGNSIKVFTEKL
jgi:peptide chain release factor